MRLYGQDISVVHAGLHRHCLAFRILIRSRARPAIINNLTNNVVDVSNIRCA